MSGRDESVWVVIHMCLETTQVISLYIYLNLKLAKTLCFSFHLIYFFFNKIREQEGRTGSAQRCWGGGGQTMYTHVNKCKNAKIKFLQSE
jgi:hypothetical protein